MSERLKIISLGVDHTGFDESVSKVLQLGLAHQPSYVCFANVHMTIEAYKDPLFLEQLNNATLVVADGRPIAAACQWLHRKKQERIAGMDFMPAILDAANKAGAGIFLFGSTNEVLEALKKKIAEKYPAVIISGAVSPPFRPLSNTEQQAHIQQINDSGAAIVLVSLGCPKQEKWMATHYKSINAVLLGIGGAFSVTAGIQKRAPRWMQNSGLEWVYRLMQEPRRMFKRYFYTNSLFLALLVKARLNRSVK